MLRRSTAMLAILAAACASAPPPRNYSPIGQWTINASSAKTQRAIFAVLMGHEAVVVAADSTALHMPLDAWSLVDRYRFADCGGSTAPEFARLTLAWGGDSARSRVELHATFSPSAELMTAAVKDDKTMQCHSTGQLEHDLIIEIRAKAEAR